MEKIKINLNDKVSGIKFLNIDTIENYDNNYRLSLNTSISEVKEGQIVEYIREFYDTNNNRQLIVEYGNVVEIIDGNNIVISKPENKIFPIKSITKINDNQYRISLKENHNIFQQDIFECLGNQNVSFYDEDLKLFKSDAVIQVDIPKMFNDDIVNFGDCVVEGEPIYGCEGSVCPITNTYNYYFLPTGASRSDIIVVFDINESDITKLKYLSFKYNPFIYENDGKLKTFTDDWFENSSKDECSKYYYNNNNSVKIGIGDYYYKANISFTSNADELNLGSEDNFNESFVNELEESLIPDFIDMERIKYIPCSERIKTGTTPKKYLIWRTVRGFEQCSDEQEIYTETIPKEGNFECTKVYYVNSAGDFVNDKCDDTSNTKSYTFGYETGPFFDGGIMPTIYKINKDENGKLIEDCKYYLSNEIYDESKIIITGLTFYLHFLKRKEIPDEERNLNSVYTSGNVYYDSWHIDPETRETTWWNGFDYSGHTFNETEFTKFNSQHGKSSDLLGYLNFTDKDIFFQKKKISQSFIRLSFYSSKDPIEQKLLYYSTIFLDGNELYGKYIKQLDYVIKNGALEENQRKGVGRINENAFIALYDKNESGLRLDTKFEVTNEYNKLKSSEGFNLYLFAEDKNFETENCEKTIYMKVEFNHAGNGKTTPLIMWPCDKNGNFTELTTENFIDNLYIEIKVSYVNGQYVYYIPRATEFNYNLSLILYEPKLDQIKDPEIKKDGNN